MGRDRNGRILGNVTSHLLRAFFHDEAAETTEIYIVVLRQGTLDALHKASTIAWTCTFSAPVLLAISLTISAFVILFIFIS